jgi:hypothetical protein
MSATSSNAYLRVSGTAAGTTVVLDHAGNVDRLIFGSNKTGTVSFYDVATAAGSAAGNLIMTVQNTSGTMPISTECGFGVKRGLIAVTGGTTDVVVVYS